MATFKNSALSHEHSLKILNTLVEYDSFLDSLQVIADMGCGSGLDAQWWATLETRDDPPEPRNYMVYAVDQNINHLESGIKNTGNMRIINANFEEPCTPRKVDLIWSHDSFQYARNPLKCLESWKTMLNENGMLLMIVPQTTYIENSRLVVSNYNHQYYSYNLLNLTYMLALSGFDTRDAFFYREHDTPWLYAAVYASQHDPVPANASWYDLAERGLINDTLMASVNKYGYARLEDVVVRWLDKDFYRINN